MNRIINISTDIRSSAKRAFDMCINPEKLTKWLCGEANVEAEVGGEYELYNAQDKNDNTVGCKVLAMNKGCYLTVEWKGPLQFASIMNGEVLTQVQFIFHPKGAHTEVTVIHSGWGVGSEWDEAYEYFFKAWQDALAKLKGVLNGVESRPKIGVTGLGGTFFKAQNPDKLKAWYDKHLGFETDQYGQSFRWVQWENTQKSGSTQWSVMPSDTKYYAPSEKPYMLNYRVGNLVALLEKLENEGVQIVGDMESYDYGKFGWVMDPEGNKIELWEPVDEIFDDYFDKVD